MQHQILLALACVFMIGCGGPPSDMPDLGEVSGTVTLNGAPLPNALVEFRPDGEGRPSTGTTDDSGHYELQYTMEYAGAKVGEHSVVVSVAQTEPSYESDNESNEDADPNSSLPPTATDGSMKHTVSAGANTIDITL